jgi:hypothetical protein
MTSQVNPNNIDGTYPVAGQDNDSQGFRDNFTNIRNNLTFAKAEIEDLQNKAVLKSALLNTSLDNDFAGAILVNPTLKTWRETYYNIGAVNGSLTINASNGNFQKFTMTGSTILDFDFPANATTEQYISVKLWVSNPSSAHTLSFPNEMTLGDPDTVSGFSGNTITFSAAEISNSTDYFFEVFTVDGGTTLGIRDLMRNRDFDGNVVAFTEFSASGNILLGKSINNDVGSNVVVRSNVKTISSTTGALVVLGGVGIAGNLHAAGNLQSDGNIQFTNGKVVLGTGAGTSNVVVDATQGSTSSTSGALVVKGGVGIAGNVFLGGNTFISGGIINTDYLLANVVTDQNLVANVDYNRFIANCDPTGTVANLFITLPNSVENGRELEITSMTAITSCFVSNMTPGVTSVYGLANNWSSSASLTNSVTIKLMYVASTGRWFKVGS